MKRKSNLKARSIWINAHGPIPKDLENRSYEIHHIDGNPCNNELSNLKLLTIYEHLQAHLNMGDWSAVALIAKRMGMPPDYGSKIQRGKKRPGVGGVPKGSIPWNKGLKGCFNEEVIEKFRQARAGKRFSTPKISDSQCLDILKIYQQKLPVPGAYEKSKNGRIQSYETAFSKFVYTSYKVSAKQIYNIIIGKRNVKTN